MVAGASLGQSLHPSRCGAYVLGDFTTRAGELSTHGLNGLNATYLANLRV
jgi:hypothetical protein